MAEPDDTALHVLLDDADRLLAYLGVVPTALSDGRRAGCMSCLWVHPQVRGQNLAKALVHRVREAWQGRLLITDYIPEVYGLYHRHLQLLDLPLAAGGIFYLKNILQGRSLRRNQRPGYTQQVGDKLINILGQKPLRHWLPLQPITAELALPIIEQWATQDAVPKTAKLLNWQDLPWLSTTESCPRYYFSSISPDYFASWYTTTYRHTSAVFLLYRRGELKVKYAYSADTELEVLAQGLFSLAYSMGAHTLHCPHTKLATALATYKRFYLYHKKYTPMLLLGQPLTNLAQKRWQLGDLDSHFT